MATQGGREEPRGRYEILIEKKKSIIADKG